MNFNFEFLIKIVGLGGVWLEIFYYWRYFNLTGFLYYRSIMLLVVGGWVGERVGNGSLFTN